MVALCLLIVLLLFEPGLINGRPYNCYSCIPCPLTNPASNPAWRCNMADYTKCNCPKPQPKPQPKPPEPAPKPIDKKRKNKKKQESSGGGNGNWVSTNIFSRLFAIPGAWADTLLNGEIVF